MLNKNHQVYFSLSNNSYIEKESLVVVKTVHYRIIQLHYSFIIKKRLEEH